MFARQKALARESGPPKTALDLSRLHPTLLGDARQVTRAPATGREKGHAPPVPCRSGSGAVTLRSGFSWPQEMDVETQGVSGEHLSRGEMLISISGKVLVRISVAL